MKNKGKKFITSAILFLITAVLAAFTACGESGFEKFADYIDAYGTLGESGDFRAVSSKNYGTDYSAMYYADAEEIAFGMRKTDEAQTDALLLIVGKNADICDVLFTRQKSGKTEPSYTALSEIMLSKPECSKLILVGGTNGDDTDYTMLVLVNGYIADLLHGADEQLFPDSGLQMSDLGFKY